MGDETSGSETHVSKLNRITSGKTSDVQIGLPPGSNGETKIEDYTPTPNTQADSETVQEQVEKGWALEPKTNQQVEDIKRERAGNWQRFKHFLQNLGAAAAGAEHPDVTRDKQARIKHATSGLKSTDEVVRQSNLDYAASTGDLDTYIQAYRNNDSLDKPADNGSSVVPSIVDTKSHSTAKEDASYRERQAAYNPVTGNPIRGSEIKDAVAQVKNLQSMRTELDAKRASGQISLEDYKKLTGDIASRIGKLTSRGTKPQPQR